MNPAQPAPDNSWHERGDFPPAGCECEVKDGGVWHKTHIVGFDDGYCVYATQWDSIARDYDGDMCQSNFRPLSTEREKAIDDMNELVGNIEEYPTWRDAMAAIYDAGYRKVNNK